MTPEQRRRDAGETDGAVPGGGAGDDDVWVDFSVLYDMGRARELLEILQGAGIACRLSYGGGAHIELEDAARSAMGPDRAPVGAWLITVPEREEPVAHGVADQLIGWWGEHPELEGDATPEEIAEALLTPTDEDPEFAERLARERAGADMRSRVLGLIAVSAVLILLFGAVIFAVI